MYTILILSRPDKFTQSVYHKMHRGNVPENIMWVGYSDFLDLGYIKCDFLSHGRKVVFDERTFAEQCLELGIEDRGKLTVAVIKMTSDSISGYFGIIKVSDATEASDRLIDLSKRIGNDENVPDCCTSCLKDVRSIDRRIKVITENKLFLLSFIPGLSLYVLGQKAKALVFAALFILVVSLFTLSIASEYPDGDIAGLFFLMMPTYFLTMFECDYLCNGDDASWIRSDIRSVLMIITFPIIGIICAIVTGSSLWSIMIPISAVISIYAIMTITKKRKYIPPKNFKIIKSSWLC